MPSEQTKFLQYFTIFLVIAAMSSKGSLLMPLFLFLIGYFLLVGAGNH